MPFSVTRIESRLQGPVLSPVPFNVSHHCDVPYPYLRLKREGNDVEHELFFIEIANECLKIRVAPGLGGRIVSVFDLVNQVEALPLASRLDIDTEGTVPAWNHGIEWISDSWSLGMIGPVTHSVIEPEDESEPVVVVLSGEVLGKDLLWQTALALLPNRSAIDVEVQLYNAGFAAALVAPGVKVSANGVDGLYHVGVTSQDHLANDSGDGSMSFTWPSAKSAELEPGQTIRFRGQVQFAPKISEDVFSDVSGTVSVDKESGRLGIVRTNSGEVSIAVAGLTAPIAGAIQASAGSLHTVTIPEISEPGAVVSVGGRKLEKAVAPAPRVAPASEKRPIPLFAFGEDVELVERTHDRAATSHALRAQILVSRGDFEGALRESSRSLEINTLDHRMWWLQSVCQRHLGFKDEREGLLQAHHLWPSDPLLRAEAFLSIPDSHTDSGSDAPNPLLAPFAADATAMVAVASHLCLLRLDQDLSRFCEACFKHRNVPMVRYLLAYALLSRSRFLTQAAENVVQAGKVGLTPPFAWRPLEFTVVKTLHDRFKDDKVLADFAGLADWGTAK